MSAINSPLFHKIRRLTGRAIGDFNLIEAGDRIAIGVSGGKDSYTLLHVLDALRRRAPVRYELVAVNVDAGFAGYQRDLIEAHLHDHAFAYRMETTNCAEIIDAKLRPGSSYCAFCARLRRGVLYGLADELGCNKIALGHHLDDIIETLLLNQFYVGRLAAMTPKLLADNGRHTVIRPLAYVEESLIAAFAQEQGYPIIDCGCPVQESADQQRQRMKHLVRELSAEIPDLRRSLISAVGNVQPRHLLDKTLKMF
jgi:tRNA 2-thiocytidine biosynthesis protein TtcA